MGRRGASSQRGQKDTGPKAKFSQLMPYLAEHKRALWLAVGLSVISAGFSLAQPLITGQVIDAVQHGKDLTLIIIIVVLIGLILLSAASGAVMYYVLARTGEGVVLSARKHIVSRLLKLPIKEYDRRRTGDLVSRVSSDSTLLRAVLTQGLVDAAGGALVFLGAVIAMAVIDPFLLVTTLLVIMVAVAAIVVSARRVRSATTKAQERVGLMAASVERSLGAIRTIRASRAEKREAHSIIADAVHAFQQGVNIAKINAAVTPIGGMAMNAAFIVVLGVGGYRVASGSTTVANLVTFILLLFLMMRPIGQAFGAYTSTQSALGALARIQEILDIKTEDEIHQGRESHDRHPVNNIAIEFEDVHFAYDPVPFDDGQLPEQKPVLQGVSFKIDRGHRTALVGPSGAGKSTILSLIERFYEPTEGRILLDGQPVQDITRYTLREQIGYVEQDAPVLAGSIKENLLIGNPQATDEELIAVLKEVNLQEVLERDERGLNAEVGENGIMLSGGERQRLAIARTLLTKAPILLLDESTSSLDGLNEQLMREAIDAVAKNRTLIVIAHRLSTVVDSDQIIVLEKGKVVGTGTHSELVKSTPLYKELAKHQLLV